MQKKVPSAVNLSGFVIVATFFSLWLAVQFEESIENMLAYVLILSFGILHGANDLKLIERSTAPGLSGKRFLKVLTYYVVFVLGSGFLFYFIPAIALFLFVLFSGYHFGEQHWNARIKGHTFLSRTFFLCYGLFMLCLLFNLHTASVALIIQNITEIALGEAVFFYGLVISGAATFVLLLILGVENKNVSASFIKELFYIGVFFVVFSTASLLWSFAIYFVLWHSIPSLVDQIDYLHGGLTIDSIKKYVWTSFPYWLISIVGLGLILFVFRDNLETSLSFFFSFLSAITFPHVLVIDRMNNS